MITVDLFGGIGNQMFQYAFGRHLSIKNKVPLTLLHIDVGAFSRRPYALGCFKLTPKVKVVLGDQRTALWRKLKTFIGGGEIVAREKGLTFDPNILDLKGDAHLHGYWQSEKYFKD